MYTFNIDADGSIFTHSYPDIGKDIGAVPVLKRLIAEGHQLILFTMRDGTELNNTVQWFADNGIPLYGIQTNPTQYSWTSSPKSYANKMIDDSAMGCPLKYDVSISDRPFIDWIKMEQMLEEQGFLTSKTKE